MAKIVLLVFIILGAIVSVIKILSQIVSQRKCVTDFEIQEFYKATLKQDDNAYRRFIAHLGICEKCQLRLHNFQKEET